MADVADNPGGGTPCDGTAILWGLLDLGAENAAIGPIADPEVVEIRFQRGVARRSAADWVARRMICTASIPVVAEVANLTDGHFVYEGPMRTGHAGWLGRAAVLQVLGRHGNVVDVLVTDRRFQAFDTAVFRSQGDRALRKEDRRGQIVRALRGAFTPIASQIIEVDTPGMLSIDLTKFDFKRLQRPIWPLDEELRN
ncbi:MAG: MlrC C-terminal domain-containing protein [Thermomicrobiales bacterium]